MIHCGPNGSKVDILWIFSGELLIEIMSKLSFTKYKNKELYLIFTKTIVVIFIVNHIFSQSTILTPKSSRIFHSYRSTQKQNQSDPGSLCTESIKSEISGLASRKKFGVYPPLILSFLEISLVKIQKNEIFWIWILHF